MKKNSVFCRSNKMIFFWALLSAPVLHAESVIYQETFGNSGSANYTVDHKAHVLTDWQVAWGRAGTKGNSTRAIVSNGASKPDAAMNIGTSNATTSESNGLIYTDVPTNTYFFFTSAETGSAIDLDPSQGLTFGWFQRNNRLDDGFRVAVQIDGLWYVTKALFSSPANAWSNQSFTFTPAAASWRLLEFTPGHSLAMGANPTADLPAGRITGFGLFTEATTGETRRFDTFSVSAGGR